MSVAAMGWAFRQKVPPAPKVVLLALADQTDERTGRVCYGKTDMPHLAEKCSVSLRSIVRAIGALVRNGYILRESGQGKRAANTYWLRLDREPAESLEDWQWFGELHPDYESDDEPGDTPQDIGVDSATVARLDNPEKPPKDDGIGAIPRAIRGAHESTEEPKNHSAQARAKPNIGFDRRAQALEIENLTLRQAAQQTGAKVFVIENTKAWNVWCLWRKQKRGIGTMPTCAGQGEFAGRRGWWMPSLFPPKDESTGPPTPTAKDDAEFAKQQGLG